MSDANDRDSQLSLRPEAKRFEGVIRPWAVKAVRPHSKRVDLNHSELHPGWPATFTRRSITIEIPVEMPDGSTVLGSLTVFDADTAELVGALAVAQAFITEEYPEPEPEAKRG